jgi:hypothetical protein
MMERYYDEITVHDGSVELSGEYAESGHVWLTVGDSAERGAVQLDANEIDSLIESLRRCRAMMEMTK